MKRSTPEKLAGTTGRRPGFTLLETMLAIGVFLLLITGALVLVGATTELVAEVSEAESESALRLGLIESTRLAFEQMGPGSALEFDYIDRGGGRYDTYLSFVATPGAFDFGANREDDVERVALAAEIQADGFIRSGLYYFAAEEWERAEEAGFRDLEAAYLELLPRMTQLSWRFHDQNAGEWRNTLDGRFPNSLVELTIRTEGQAEPLRAVFWHLGGTR